MRVVSSPRSAMEPNKSTPETLEAAGPRPDNTVRILTLNCWGLKYLSQHRRARLAEIGRRLATHLPRLDIVGLQECWTYADYVSIRQQTRHVLPHGKFYHSGVFGGGLVILSRWPIDESSMFRYPLNGRPTAFFRGDWYVGKGVACARVRMPDGQSIEVFNTHLHAPYEREPNDSYICHRTAQAWEIAKLMCHARERGSLVIGLGDFNMVPLSFAHVLVEARGGVWDVWRTLRPDSSVGASIDDAERERRSMLSLPKSPTVEESLRDHGHTCDSVLNTWRWNKAHRRELEKGRDRQVSLREKDESAKRLDYIFWGADSELWEIKEALVSMTERHPTLRCSLSDHFAVEAVIERRAPGAPPVEAVQTNGIQGDGNTQGSGGKQMAEHPLTTGCLEDILEMIDRYTLRERKQRRWRLSHFLGSCIVSIGCFIAIWWSPTNYVSFVLILVSSLGLVAGTLDGLIGGLFVGSELRALKEFEWEIRNAIQQLGDAVKEERPLGEGYDREQGLKEEAQN